MITDFKIFEENKDNYSEWRTGDWVRCINASPHEELLTVGRDYEIDDKHEDKHSITIRVYSNKREFQWFNMSRFTKNMKHPELIKLRFDL